MLKAQCPAVRWMPYRQTSPRLSPNLLQSKSGHMLNSQTLRFELRNVIVDSISLREAGKKKSIGGLNALQCGGCPIAKPAPAYHRTCPGVGRATGWTPKTLNLLHKTNNIMDSISLHEAARNKHLEGSMRANSMENNIITRCGSSLRSFAMTCLTHLHQNTCNGIQAVLADNLQIWSSWWSPKSFQAPFPGSRTANNKSAMVNLLIHEGTRKPLD